MTTSPIPPPKGSWLRTLVVMASVSLFAVLVLQAQTGCDPSGDTKVSAEPKGLPAPTATFSAVASAAAPMKPAPTKPAPTELKPKVKPVPTFFPASKSGFIPLPAPNAPQTAPVGQGTGSHQ